MRAAVGTRKGLFFVERRRSGWSVSEPAFLGASVSCVGRNPHDGSLWVGLHHGHWGPKLHRTDNEGARWEELGCPAFPEGATAPDRHGRPLPAIVRRLLVLAWPGEAGRACLGTDPGALFESRDGGASWILDAALWRRRVEDRWFPSGGGLMLHSIEPDPRDPSAMHVAVSCGGTYATTDGGATWQPRNAGVPADYLPERFPPTGQDVHRLRRHPAAPDELWQTNHCGVYCSEDAGHRWTDVSAGLPTAHAFPLALDRRRPGRAWVVPHLSDAQRVAPGGALAVWESADRGRTWTARRAGLPQRHCWDIVFRHAFEARGDQLLLGTTCGRLFASGDGGRSWEAIDAMLPPVHALLPSDE